MLRFASNPGLTIVKPNLAALTLLGAVCIVSKAEASEAFGPGFDWTGAYFGFNAGFASNESSVDGAVNYAGEHYKDLASEIQGDESTLMGGGLLGYNYQTANIVFGAEADVNYLGFSDARSKAREVDIYDVTKNTTFDATWFGTLRGRLGYSLGGLLIYGTGGLAVGDMQATASVKAVDAINGEYVKWKGSTDSINWGWTGGLGAEYGISNVSFGLEYLYVDLGTAEWDGTANGLITDIVDNSKAKGSAEYQFSLIRATAKLQF